VHEEKIGILREMFPDSVLRKGGTEFVCRCPSKSCKADPRYFAKKKLEINLSGDYFACWRCHYRGHMIQLLRAHATPVQKARYSKLIGLKVDSTEEVQGFVLPDEYKFVLDDFRTNNTAKRIYEWLSGQGISDDSILQNRVGYVEDGELSNRVLFPSYDKECELNYFVTRHIWLKNQYRWLKCSRSSKGNIWNEHLIDWNRPIILTESVKTYLKFFDQDKNIVTNNGSGLNKNYKLFASILMECDQDIIIAFDPDAKGEALTLSEELSRFGCIPKIATFDKQPDELSFCEFQEAIKSAKQFSKFDSLKHRISQI
jgi:hypothetical protein